MKKTIRFIAMATLCLFLSSVKAQERPLKIGDTVPDVTLKNIINYSSSTVKLSDFKGKILVFAFWNTRCRSTRESMREMNEIQLSLNEQIQVIAVSDDSPGALRTAFANDALLAATRVPIVTGDSSLSTLFPNLILPHLVWIVDVKVKAITDIQYLNKENINAALSESHLNWPVKSDVPGFNYSEPFLYSRYNQPGKPQPTYYSQISPFLPGVASRYGVEIDSVNQTVRTWVVNAPAYQMYLMAFNRLLGVAENHIIWEVQDKSGYVYEETNQYQDTWNRANSYCYESILPIGISAKERLDRMRTDLNSFLNLDGRFEKRIVDVLVLEFDDAKLPLTAGGKFHNTLHRSDTIKVMRNIALSGIAWEMNKFASNPPVLIDKRVNPRVDLDLPVGSMTDIQAIQKSLEPYGISLKNAKREVEFFILTEKFHTKLNR